MYTERGGWNPCAKRGRIKMDGRNGGRSERGAMSYSGGGCNWGDADFSLMSMQNDSEGGMRKRRGI